MEEGFCQKQIFYLSRYEKAMKNPDTGIEKDRRDFIADHAARKLVKSLLTSNAWRAITDWTVPLG